MNNKTRRTLKIMETTNTIPQITVSEITPEVKSAMIEFGVAWMRDAVAKEKQEEADFRAGKTNTFVLSVCGKSMQVRPLDEKFPGYGLIAGNTTSSIGSQICNEITREYWKRHNVEVVKGYTWLDNSDKFDKSFFDKKLRVLSHHNGMFGDGNYHDEGEVIKFKYITDSGKVAFSPGNKRSCYTSSVGGWWVKL